MFFYFRNPKFWAYLWGIETGLLQDIRFALDFVLSLPMRNWNELFVHIKMVGTSVLSLPMRNWNGQIQRILQRLLQSFEPTYEELKLSLPSLKAIRYVGFEPTYEELKLVFFCTVFTFRFSFWAYLWGIETFIFFQRLLSHFLFWAYLWGIETLDISKNKYRLNSVLSLPMRNWNRELLRLKRRKRKSFEPTYEELKHVDNIRVFPNDLTGFEPTYEELKPESLTTSDWAEALFWAYLWGIETTIQFDFTWT